MQAKAKTRKLKIGCQTAFLNRPSGLLSTQCETHNPPAFTSGHDYEMNYNPAL